MTSSGSLIEINFLGFSARGRPPLLTTPLASMSSVNSGSSSHSSCWMTCEATLARSEPKDLADTRYFAVICFPHAENMAFRTTRCVANNHHSIMEHAEANHSPLAIVFSIILSLKVRSIKDLVCIPEIETSIRQGLCALAGIAGDCHTVNVTTSTVGKARSVGGKCECPPSRLHQANTIQSGQPTR